MPSVRVRSRGRLGFGRGPLRRRACQVATHLLAAFLSFAAAFAATLAAVIQPSAVELGTLLRLALQLVLKDLVFNAAKVLQELLDLGQVRGAAIGKVLAHRGEDLDVQRHHLVDAPVADGQGRQMRKEVIAHEEAHENEVVHDPLEVIRQGRGHPFLQLPKLQHEVLPQDGDRQDLEGLLNAHLLDLLGLACALRGDVARAAAQRAFLLRLGDDDLADDGKVRLVRRQTQHDQVGVGPVQAMPHVGIVLGLSPLQPDERHDLVFPLARDVGVGQNATELQLLPERVVGHAVVDVIADGLRHLVQEVRARRDDIGIEELRALPIR
mmetsp:Transcript_20315/g.60840  ORF Transcript_20315/g.60840 Transcript_20315/m.60840 type:complete len:324 (+) Transcript_20315:1137-2108(+)